MLTAEAIAVFLSDLYTIHDNPRISGYPSMSTVLYRTNAALPSDASRMSRDVAESFPTESPFVPIYVFVVTWFSVAPCCLKIRSNVLNTFQVRSVANDQSPYVRISLFAYFRSRSPLTFEIAHLSHFAMII